LSQTAKFFNAFELFAYCLMTSTAYWQRRLPDGYNYKLGNLANLTIFLYTYFLSKAKLLIIFLFFLFNSQIFLNIRGQLSYNVISK
uniref:hypothetical protein n=1 Tax=Peptoniphilus grossensis TaxID=1465756 RepID=UPI00288AA6BA